MPRTPILALALALAACNGPLEPHLDFESEHADQGPERATASAVQGGNLVVNGTIEVPNECQRLEGSVNTSAGVTVTVRSAGSLDPACGTEAVFIDYRALVQGLDAGTYDVTVVHAPLGGEERTVLQRQVTVN